MTCKKNDPIEAVLEEGISYFWCACGLSQKGAFCDGSHKGTGLKSHMFSVQASGTVRLCGCKKTKTLPFCDGSHAAG